MGNETSFFFRERTKSGKTEKGKSLLQQKKRADHPTTNNNNNTQFVISSQAHPHSSLSHWILVLLDGAISCNQNTLDLTYFVTLVVHLSSGLFLGFCARKAGTVSLASFSPPPNDTSFSHGDRYHIRVSIKQRTIGDLAIEIHDYSLGGRERRGHVARRGSMYHVVTHCTILYDKKKTSKVLNKNRTAHFFVMCVCLSPTPTMTIRSPMVWDNGKNGWLRRRKVTLANTTFIFFLCTHTHSLTHSLSLSRQQ